MGSNSCGFAALRLWWATCPRRSAEGAYPCSLAWARPAGAAWRLDEGLQAPPVPGLADHLRFAFLPGVAGGACGLVPFRQLSWAPTPSRVRMAFDTRAHWCVVVADGRPFLISYKWYPYIGRWRRLRACAAQPHSLAPAPSSVRRAFDTGADWARGRGGWAARGGRRSTLESFAA